MCSRKMTSSAWNSVEILGQVAKKQPLCITGPGRLVVLRRKMVMHVAVIKSGLLSAVETRQLCLHLPFPTVKRKKKLFKQVSDDF